MKVEMRKVVVGVALCWLVLLPQACGGPTPTASREAGAADGHEAQAAREAKEHGHGETHIVELTAEAAARAEVRTTEVEQRLLDRRWHTTGQVDFDQTRLAHVSPRISGRVYRVSATLGQQVVAGEELAQVDSIELGRAKASYLQARTQQELTRQSFERTRDLFQDRIVSEQEALAAEAEFRGAEAALGTAEETLHLYGLSQEQVEALSVEHPGERSTASIYPLRAPFAGTVIERHATLGELVTPERNLFTLADLSRVWVWIDVHQRDLDDVHLGDGARVRVDAFPAQVFEGTVSYLDAHVDADTRTLRARLDLDNARGQLRAGMFVDVELIDPHALEGETGGERGLVVPETALVRDGDEYFVFVELPAAADGDRRFARRRVEIGRRGEGFVQVLDLQSGETVQSGEPIQSGEPMQSGGTVQAGEQVVVEGAFVLKSAASKGELGTGHAH